MTTDFKPQVARYGLIITANDDFKLPVGTTAQRRGGNNAGYARLNTSLERLEYNSGSRWEYISIELQYQGTRTSAFTAVAGNAYPVNTASGVVEATFPSSPRTGQMVAFFDANGAWATNGCRLVSSDNIEGMSSSKTLDIAFDHSIWVWSGIAAVGWVRKSGGFPTADIQEKLDLKADITYVDKYHERATGTDVPGGANTTVVVAKLPTTIRAAKMLVAAVGASTTELLTFDVVKDGSNNVSIIIDNEVASATSLVTVTGAYNGGIELKLASSSSTTFKLHTIWQTA